MDRLDEIALEQLHEVCGQTDGGKPGEHVFAAIGRNSGDLIEMLAEQHDVVKKTIHDWLDRFLFEPIEQSHYRSAITSGLSLAVTTPRTDRRPTV